MRWVGFVFLFLLGILQVLHTADTSDVAFLVFVIEFYALNAKTKATYAKRQFNWARAAGGRWKYLIVCQSEEAIIYYHDSPDGNTMLGNFIVHCFIHCWVKQYLEFRHCFKVVHKMTWAPIRGSLPYPSLNKIAVLRLDETRRLIEPNDIFFFGEPHTHSRTHAHLSCSSLLTQLPKVLLTCFFPSSMPFIFVYVPLQRDEHRAPILKQINEFSFLVYYFVHRAVSLRSKIIIDFCNVRMN